MSKKITQLVELTAPDDNDQFVVVDTEVGSTKRITRGNMLANAIGPSELEANAVTTAKIADDAITSAKMGLVATTDANGWTVWDFGGFKEYRKRFTINQTIAANTAASLSLGTTTLPTGVSNISLHYITATAFVSGSAHAFDWNLEMTTSSTAIGASARNDTGSSLLFVGSLDVLISGA